MTRLLKWCLRFLLQLLYRVEVSGIEHYQTAGERVLIIANHTSLLDGLLLYAWLPETPTFAINPAIANKSWVKPFLLFVRIFELDATNPLAIKSMINYIRQDKKAVIFLEGQVTVISSLMKVYEGTGLIADKSEAAVLPIAINGAQYSRLSYMKGNSHVCWFLDIRLTILPPQRINPPAALRGHSRRKVAARQLYDLMYQLIYTSFDQQATLYSTLLDSAKRFGHNQWTFEDVNRDKLRYNDLILRSILLGDRIKQQTKDGEHVGVLMPNVNALPILFFALQFINRVPTMLNFTSGARAIKRACETAQVNIIYSSRAFIENAKLEKVISELEQAITIIYLEELRQQLGLTAKLAAWYKSKMPARHYKKQKTNSEAAAVILFTSGSEGQPRGVVLSHRNLLANFAQVRCYIDFNAKDIVFSCLPLFHSFGLNAGFLMPLYGGSKVFLYPTPLHYQIIPELIYELGATILFGTNTFLRAYARYAHPFDFYVLRYVVAGAEKLHEDTVQLWLTKFGKRIFQGYGVTEASPVISVNNPLFNKIGTVGRLLTAMEFYLKPVAGIQHGGRLIVKGANIMQGYLLPDKPGKLEPPATERGVGWYDTGDIVAVDDEGYFTILGRAKRFAKIGGEMVSLAAVEELAMLTWPNINHAAVAIEDPRKGERIILFTEKSNPSRQQLQQTSRTNHISELTLPKAIISVANIPVLSTGKTDYIRLKQQAGSNDNKRAK